LAYWQGLVMVGSIRQWFNVFSAVSGPGESGNEIANFPCGAKWRG
jgi:hypothetical protein